MTVLLPMAFDKVCADSLLGAKPPNTVSWQFGVGGDKAHATGTGVFQIRIEEIGGLADAGRADHQAVDIVIVHQRISMGSGIVKERRFPPADDEALRFRGAFTLSPLLRLIWDFGICLFDLTLGCPARRAVLAVADRFGLDAV